jgi:hypothetical protein
MGSGSTKEQRPNTHETVTVAPPAATYTETAAPARPTNRSSSMAASACFVDPNHWVSTHLKGSLTGKQFISTSAELLEKYGMTSANTVACISVCRDEMCQALVDVIEEKWGASFNMSSLGGMLWLGKTGLKAAMHHAPVINNRERYFFLAFSHIAVDIDGIGVCTRIGRSTRSNACGALCGFRSELKAGNVRTTVDPSDHEFTLLKQELIKHISYGSIPDLLELTKITAKVILEQLESLTTTVDTAVADYAVCVGIQVHKHDATTRQSVFTGYAGQYVDIIWPISFYCVTDGVRHDLLSSLQQA